MAGNLIRVFKRNMQDADANDASIWNSPSSPIADIHSVVANLQRKGRHLRLKDVDEFFTAKVGGLHKKNGGVFPLGGADDYYKWASSKEFITNVRRYVILPVASR
jgi:predicted alpha/beta-fold hydrolase